MKKLRSSYKLVGINLGDLCKALLVIIAITTTAHYVWGPERTTYLWLIGLTTWIFLHIKQSMSTHERLNEMDQRDMDFHDHVDKKMERLDKEIENLKP
jgi:hypothetical protein